jgi:hypothetical protein
MFPSMKPSSALAIARLVPWLVVAFHSRLASAEEPTWHPGRRTTSNLAGEVQPREVPDQDGVYGRFDGDVFLGVGAGVELDAGVRVGGVARALFYQSAGLVAGYAQAPSSDASLERIGFVGAELRPLFLPRFALDLEGMGPLLDLTFDSLSLGAGVCFPAEAGSDRNAALEFSMGLGVPLFLRANGLWLEARAALRPALSADSGQLFLLLSWYEAIETAIVR